MDGAALAFCPRHHIPRHPDFTPPSNQLAGEVLIELPTSVEAKVLLLNALVQSGISNAELARRMGTRPQEVQRIVNLGHATKIDTIAAALRALGRHLTLQVA